MILTAFLLAAASVAEVQPAQPLSVPVVVTRRRDNAPVWLMGFAAFGSDADLGRLEAATSAISARSRRVTDDPRGRLEVMVLFASLPRERALRLYRDTLAGRYGRLAVEAVVITIADARDGIDVANEVRLVDPATLRDE